MAQRVVCLYNGQKIGIESIYTVCDGKQINIPGEVERLRRLGRQNQLFCPCGCGANLIVVAGDRNLREQHFRIKDSKEIENCTALVESNISILSKIMLKCWLDDKLHSAHLESRVPLNRVCESERKFEFSFFDFDKMLGVCYWYERANIISDKVDEIEEYSQAHKIIYVTDIHNAGTKGQYPEFMIKIQNKQGYNLYLNIYENDINDVQYGQVYLDTRIYVKNRYDVWQETIVISDKLDSYSFSLEGELLHNDKLVRDIVQQAIQNFTMQEERLLIIEEEKREENIRQLELQRKKEELERQERQKKREEQQKREAEEQKEREIVINREYEKEISRIKAVELNQQDKLVLDSRGQRWVRCEYCGKESTIGDFVSYGGVNHINLGTCYECSRAGKNKVQIVPVSVTGQKKPNRNVCPECGSSLLNKRGRYGEFLGCSNYPNCTFTANINV